jgi:hypothetical protein
MRELFTHAVHSGKVILPSHCTCATINEREREAYLDAGTKTITKAWWLAVPFSVFFIFWFVSVRSRPV